MCADDLLPRGGLLPLWRRREAMALEDVPHGLVTHGVSEIGQCSHNPIIAPRTIFLGYADNQGLQLCSNLRTSKGLALLGAIELLGHQLAVPGEDRVGCDDACDLRQRLLAQLLANLGQNLALTIAQVYPACDLEAQHAVFSPSILV